MRRSTKGRPLSVVLVVIVLIVTGCAGARPAASVRPGSAATVSPTQDDSASPSGSASTRTSPKPTPTGPTIPDAAGALNVSGYESAHFASPTGAIWCAMNEGYTLCHFPKGMNSSKVPSTKKVCPGSGLDVTGVSVEVVADYFCSGGAEALPMTNGLFVDWWKTTGFPSVKYDGFKLATLPYGKKLVYKRFVCLSEKSGVTCVNTDNRAGFKVAKSGVTIYT